MGTYIDLSGRVFGRLKVLRRAENSKGRVAFRCACECGNIVVVTSHALMTGNTSSCGCIHSEQLIHRNTKHGERFTKLYTIWLNMKQRCNSAKPRYKAWHGRGIKVCPEWDKSFLAFKTWACANGYKDGLTIDRVDVNGDYCPENCRWISKREQSWNKTNTRYFEYKGTKKCLSEWSAVTGISLATLRTRVYNLGWSIEKALETEVKHVR